MNADLARIRERMAQTRQALRTYLTDRATNTAPHTTAQSGTFIAGDRVFDTVTGEEGIVIHGTRENVIVPAPER